VPYLVSLPNRKPYLPGVSVLDDQSGILSLNIRHKGDLITYGMTNGVPLDPEIVPTRFELEISADQMPGLISLAVGWGANDTFRRKVEELEPGVHQFFRAEISTKSGDHPKAPYWVMNVCNRVDAIDSERSVMRPMFEGQKYSRDGLAAGVEAKLVLKNQEVLGMCMWVDRRYTGGLFFSDKLFDFVEETGLAELISWKVYAE